MQNVYSDVYALSMELATCHRDQIDLEDRLQRVIGFPATLPASHPDKALALDAAQRLLNFKAKYGDEATALARALDELLDTCRAIERDAMQRTQWDHAGNFFGAAHSLVNIINKLLCSIGAARLWLEAMTVLACPKPVPPRWELLQRLAKNAESVPQSEFPAWLAQNQPEMAAATAAVLDAIQPGPPSSRSPLRQVSHQLSRNILILLVEDDEAWLAPPDAALGGDIRQAVESVVSQYRQEERSLRVETARTYDDAKTVLDEAGSNTSVILVLDLGIPKNQEELQAVRDKRSTVGRQWGRALLQEAREYRHRYHVLLCTTMLSYGEDHTQALALGVSPRDFVVKGPDALANLTDSLNRVLETPRRPPVLEILINTGRRVRLNGREFDLTKEPFQLLTALAGRQKRTYSLAEIAALLEDRYPGEYDTGADAESAFEQAQAQAIREGLTSNTAAFTARVNALLPLLSAPANACECWPPAAEGTEKTEPGEDAEKAAGLSNARRRVIRFWNRCHAWANHEPWRWFVKQAALPAQCEEGPPRQWEESLIIQTHAAAEELFRAERAKRCGFDCRRLHDTVYALRQALYRETGDNGEFSILLGLENGYQRVAEIIECDDAYPPATPVALEDGEMCRVLVVEDDPVWRRDVRQALAHDYKVETAADLSEGEAKAWAWRPHILCLDLHLPPLSSPTTGLELLKRVQKENPRVKAIVLSSAADEGDVRAQATRLGVDVQALVGKQPPAQGTWENELLRAAWKCEQELRYGVLLPPSETDVPFLQVALEDGGHGQRYIHITTGGSATKVQIGKREMRLLRVLAEMGDRPIMKDDLLEQYHEGEIPDSDEGFTAALQQVRKALTERGLGLVGEAARKAGRKYIKELDGAYLVRFKIQ